MKIKKQAHMSGLAARLAAFAAAVMMLMTVLPACRNDSGGGDESSTRPEETKPARICADGVSEYEIIRPDRNYDGKLKEAVQALRKALNDYAGVDMKVSEDWVRDTAELPAEACEILVGATNRAESVEALAGLKTDDYRVRYCAASRRIVIVGGSDAATAAAVEYFIDSFVKGGNGLVELPQELDYTYMEKYEVEKLTLNGHDISEFEIVIPNAANRDEKYAAQLIGDALALKTGSRPATVTVAKASGAPSIRIGSAADAVSLAAGEMCVGSAPGAPATLLVGGSGGYAVAAARSFIKKYIAPASGDTVTETAEAVPAAFERAVYPADEAGIVGGTRVALADQQNAACVVVDIADGDNAKPLWTFAPLSSKGFTVSKFGNRIDECRLRYSEVLGKYVICVTSSSGFVGVGEYPSGNRVFDVVLPGYGPHSIEYLPSGAVAVACSGNGNESKAMIRFYAANEKGAVMLKCKSVMLEGAHGIIWDDVRELLWAVGTKDIVAFEVSGELTGATLSAVPVYSATLPKNGGHDIAAFYGDPDRVWIGGGNIVIFNKSTGTFADAPGSVSSGNTKCIGNLDDGRIIRTVATNVYAAHDTDRYLLFDANGQQISETVFTSRAFYKTRLFDPRYTG